METPIVVGKNKVVGGLGAWWPLPAANIISAPLQSVGAGSRAASTRESLWQDRVYK